LCQCIFVRTSAQLTYCFPVSDGISVAAVELATLKQIFDFPDESICYHIFCVQMYSPFQIVVIEHQ
jgi:hypothetical protein